MKVTYLEALQIKILSVEKDNHESKIQFKKVNSNTD